MTSRTVHTIVTRLTTALAQQIDRIRRTPDAGVETVDKILWAAAITIVVSTIGAIFRTKLEAFVNGLTVTLGW